MEISRVNVELIAWAWCKTRFKSRITYAEQQLDDYAMDTKVDNTWEMAEWLDKHESGNTHTRAHSRVLIGGGGRGGGFDREKRSGLGGDGRYRGGGRGEGSHFNRRGDGGDDRGGRSVERSATPAVEVAVRAAATSTRSAATAVGQNITSKATALGGTSCAPSAARRVILPSATRRPTLISA